MRNYERSGETKNALKDVKIRKGMQEASKTLKTREGMLEAFEQIGLIPINNTRYSEVQNLVRAPGEKIKEGEQENMQDWVRKIAERLVSRRKL